MIQKFGKADEANIKEIEQKLKITLPQDYRAFLAGYNGGSCEDIIVFKVEGIEETIALDLLYGIGLKDGLNILDWCEEYADDLLEDMIIIGHTMETGLLLLIHQEDWKGIYFWDHCIDYEESTEEECIYKIADSFDDFIKGLSGEE